MDTELGKAVPHGTYVPYHGEGWVSVADTADTPQLAVESIRRWWGAMGKQRFFLRLACSSRPTPEKPTSPSYSPSARSAPSQPTLKLSRTRRQLPPAARPRARCPSTWNSAVRRSGELLSAYKEFPLTIDSRRPNWCPTGVKVTNAELAAVPLVPHDWHGDWNCTITAH